MSKIHVRTIVVAAILALAATAFAQLPPGHPAIGQQPAAPGQRGAGSQDAPTTGAAISPAEALTRQLTQLLNLSGTQATQVRSTLEDEHSQLLALRDDSTMSTPDKQAKLMDIRRNASHKIMSVLTPEQQKKLADAIQRQHEQDQQPGAQPPAQQPPR